MSICTHHPVSPQKYVIRKYQIEIENSSFYKLNETNIELHILQ